MNERKEGRWVGVGLQIFEFVRFYILPYSIIHSKHIYMRNMFSLGIFFQMEPFFI